MDILGLVQSLRQVRATLVANGGFTLDTTTGLGPLTGYALSVNPELTVILPGGWPTVGDLLGFVLDNDDILDHPDKYFGAWVDTETNQLYLDVVTVFQELEDALRHAKASGEIAIYDLFTGTEIRVDYSEGSDK